MKVKMMFLVLLFPFILAFLYTDTIAQNGEIRGRVMDETGRIPLQDANVMIKETVWGAATDKNGYYIINNIPVGIYNISFSYVGYNKIMVTDVVVKSGKIITVNADLKLNVAEGEIVTVTAGYFQKPDDAPVSVSSLNHEEIRRSPGAREDVSRMIQNFAGVNPGSDDRNDLIIRGGSPTEVLFVIDNIDIPNPNHFATQGATGGPISLINMEFIENVKFMAGGFTAPYGHKLSGAVDIKLREGSRNEYNGKLDLSFGGAGGYLEGPVNNGRGSFLIGAHRSYLDLFKSVLNYDGVPIYSNIQGKAVYDLNRNNRISLIVMGGTDKIEIIEDNDADDFRAGVVDTVEYDDPTDFRSEQLTGGVNLRTFWNKNLYSNLSVSFSHYGFSTDVTEKSISAIRDENNNLNNEKEIKRASVYKNESTESVTTIKNDFFWSLPGNNGLSFGVYGKNYTFNHEIKIFPYYPDRPDKYGVLPDTEIISRNQKDIYKTGGYINLKKYLGKKLLLNIGGRYDYFSMLEEGNFSPRIGFRYSASPRISFNAGAGRYFQNPEFINITGDTQNKYALKDMGADHIITGMEYLLTGTTRFTLETYYKRYFNYPVVDESGYEMISLANTGSDYGSTGSNRLSSKGEGRAYGIETMIQKKVTGHLYGLVSYSYSEIKHKALDGILRPGTFDNRHVANILLGCRINKKYEISLKWRYAGGRPYTPYDYNSSVKEGRGVLDLNRINENRYKDYSRLDLRFDTRDFFSKFTLISYTSIENIFDTKNILTTYWRNGKQRYNHQTGRFFVGGVSVEF